MKKLLFFIFTFTFYNLFPAGGPSTPSVPSIPEAAATAESPSTPKLVTIGYRDHRFGIDYYLTFYGMTKISEYKNIVAKGYENVKKQHEDALQLLKKLSDPKEINIFAMDTRGNSFQINDDSPVMNYAFPAYVLTAR